MATPEFLTRGLRAVAALLAVNLLLVAVGSTSASAQAGPTGRAAAAAPKKISDADVARFTAVLASIPADASPETAASILFPHDEVKKNEYKRIAKELDRAAEREAAKKPAVRGVHVKALPVAIAVLIPITVRCVANGLGAAGINEVITLAHKGQRATAESRVYALVGGCISALFPGPLKWVANRIKRPIAAAVLAVMIRWYA